MIIPLNDEHWSVEYDGYGEVNIENDLIELQPKAATSNNETHAALVLSDIKVRDFYLKITAKTVEQLRENNTPNPWEVFWIFFNYIPAEDNNKDTNYFVLKQNGYELGRAWEETKQCFLDTGNNPQLILDTEYVYEIKKEGKNVQVWIDGQRIINFTDNNNEMTDDYGYIGFYSEDAVVNVSGAEISV